ncbi:MAG TPA: nuclear transport factor 2 family protein [Saprospiraceae bacterium]
MKQAAIIIYFFLSLSSPIRSQELEIRATIDKMFTSMYKADTANMRTCFTPGANLMTYSYDSKGHSRAKGETLNDFLRGVGIMGEADMEERLIGWQCLVDEGIASVWTPYEFYFEGKFSHCGVNSFQLMKVQGIWKITMITDTRRKTDCPTDQASIATIDSLMNLWHQAAAKADEEAFFGRMTEDAIYIGTDATERWLRDELREWSKEYFKKEKAWDFKPLSRNITIGPGGQMAWFDELLDTWMGTCRSTGIVERFDGEWKIIYYHLSVAVPNDKMDGYRQLIGKGKG